MRFKNKDLFWKFFIIIRLWFEKMSWVIMTIYYDKFSSFP